MQPPGELGEIVASGYASPGHLGQPDETAASFDPDGTFRTGDLGHLDADGELHFAGRASEMIRTGGINVSPLEVEEFLLTHDAVEEAMVVGVADPKADQVPIAFVRTTSPHDTDEAMLLAFCRDQIAAYKVPRRIVPRTTALPRTANRETGPHRAYGRGASPAEGRGGLTPSQPRAAKLAVRPAGEGVSGDAGVGGSHPNASCPQRLGVMDDDHRPYTALQIGLDQVFGGDAPRRHCRVPWHPRDLATPQPDASVRRLFPMRP
ncbi:class I adenylate-forming enzyme family protein [Streptomyces sp. NPDC056910]|uniref:class I adenylate-forming enzyme family protein n=1 Tax=Streptomyces sp. NPDC056910 TaxID=3345964 RepID=UPI00369EFAC9